MVIDGCVALGDANPIAFIHDVGAGGLSNALPELVKDAGFAGKFELRQIESADSSMSPLQIWCCEAQERYVMLVNPDSINKFVSIASKYFVPPGYNLKLTCYRPRTMWIFGCWHSCFEPKRWVCEAHTSRSGL